MLLTAYRAAGSRVNVLMGIIEMDINPYPANVDNMVSS